MSKKLRDKGILYKGSGEDPAVRKVIEKLYKDGADSIDYRWQPVQRVNVDDKDTKRRNRSA